MELFNISKVRKAMVHIRTWSKFIILIAIAAFLVIGILAFTYKPIYSVTLQGEFIGYSANKSQLQEKINTYIEKGNGENNVAFVEVNNLPEYQLCLLKKDIVTNDEEIYQKVTQQGTPYYKYYAISVGEEEKVYVSNFNEAEEAVKQLKDKNSSNKESLAIIEKYETEEKEVTEVATVVSDLYVAPVVKKAVANTRSTSSAGSYATGMNNSSTKIDIGISLIRPVSGTLTSRYGLRSRNNHKGIDIGAPKGTPIKAAAGGTVIVSSYGYNGGYGNYVIVSHGNGVQTVYGHCNTLTVNVGDKVSQGQQVATVGSTGVSTGNHLHLEIRVNGVVQNPQNYVY